MSDIATLGFYEDNAARYIDSFDDRPSRHLDDFLDRLPEGGRVLELGCGGGRDSLRIVERGFSVDATDGAVAMVERARARTGLPVRLLRFDKLAAEGEYEAVWAHACLLHVPRAELPKILAAIFKSLRRQGWHFANYKLGDGEDRDHLGRLANFPDEVWISEAYRAAGFEIVATERYRGEGADGVIRDWIGLTVRKPR